MDLQLCYNASEDTFPLSLHFKQFYGPFGFPTPCDGLSAALLPSSAEFTVYPSASAVSL